MIFKKEWGKGSQSGKGLNLHHDQKYVTVFLVLMWPLRRRCASFHLLEEVTGLASHSAAFGSLSQLKQMPIYS